MLKFIESPNCPSSRVIIAILSAMAPIELQGNFKKRGIELILTPKHPNLLEGEAFHPDMQLFYAGGGGIVVCPELYDYYKSVPQLKNAVFVKGDTPLSPKYPENTAYNACKVGQYLICNVEKTDPQILRIAENDKLEIIPVKQGYAKCSIAILSDGAIITSDTGIYNILLKTDIDVLKISYGSIKLPGFEYGFIGGACGKLSKDMISFFGDIEIHPDFKMILRFCDKHNCEIISLSDEIPQDLGSFIPIFEE